MKNIHSKSLAYLLLGSALVTNSYAEPDESWKEPHWNGSTRVLHRAADGTLSVLDYTVYEDRWTKGTDGKWKLIGAESLDASVGSESGEGAAAAAAAEAAEAGEGPAEVAAAAAEPAPAPAPVIRVTSHANLKMFGPNGEYYSGETTPFGRVDEWRDDETGIFYPRVLRHAERSIASLVNGEVKRHPLTVAMYAMRKAGPDEFRRAAADAEASIDKYNRMIAIQRSIAQIKEEGKSKKEEWVHNNEQLTEYERLRSPTSTESKAKNDLKGKTDRLKKELTALKAQIDASMEEFNRLSGGKDHTLQSLIRARQHTTQHLAKIRARLDAGGVTFLTDQYGLAAGEEMPVPTTAPVLEGGEGPAEAPVAAVAQRPVHAAIAQLEANRVKVENALRWNVELPILQTVLTGVKKMSEKHSLINLSGQSWLEKYERDIAKEVRDYNDAFMALNPVTEEAKSEWMKKQDAEAATIANLTDRVRMQNILVEDARMEQAKARALSLDGTPGKELTAEQNAFLISKNDYKFASRAPVKAAKKAAADLLASLDADALAGLETWYGELKTRQAESLSMRVSALLRDTAPSVEYLGNYNELYSSVTKKFDATEVVASGYLRNTYGTPIAGVARRWVESLKVEMAGEDALSLDQVSLKVDGVRSAE